MIEQALDPSRAGLQDDGRRQPHTGRLRVVTDLVARRLVSISAAIEAVEDVLKELDGGGGRVLPVAAGKGTAAGSSFAIKAGVLDKAAIVGHKTGSYWPGNRAAGLSSHFSTTILLDPETGFPSGLVFSSYLTALRTAAADAVAIKHLARPDASSLAIVGTGHQAWFELLAALEVRPIEHLFVWSRNGERAAAFASRARRELGLYTVAALDSAEAAVASADIVITATAAEEPLVQGEWLKSGAHISAMGADAVGKQELSLGLVESGHLFADIVDQSVSIGEFQHAVSAGLVRRSDISTLGSVISGAAPGRTGIDEVTIFDSSGMALQDLAVGALALRLASDKAECDFIDL